MNGYIEMQPQGERESELIHVALVHRIMEVN